MAGKRRVHELAKELGVTSSDVLARLNEQGENVKSASSTLESRVIRRIRESYGTTVADLARGLGLPEKVILDFIRYLGVAQKPEDALTPQLAAQIRKKFRSAQGRDLTRTKDGSTAARKLKQVVGGDNSSSNEMTREPGYVYVCELTAAVAHHQDYLGGSSDRALCGHQFIESGEPGPVAQTQAVCEQCVGRLPAYHEKWWRDRFYAIKTELATFRGRYHQLETRCESQQQQLAALQRRLDQINKSRQRKPTKSQTNNKRRVLKSAAATKRPQKGASRTSQVKGASGSRVVDPEVVRKRVKEILAPRPPKTVAEKWADEAAAETMRSHKPSSWRRRYRAK